MASGRGGGKGGPRRVGLFHTGWWGVLFVWKGKGGRVRVCRCTAVVLLLYSHGVCA
jgi:hypothetical protein